LAVSLLVVLIVLSIARSLSGHLDSLVRAARQLAGISLLWALVLCVIHRVINAAGWGLVLRSLGQPLEPLVGVRLWLASEACRWLPGSVWSYGSRTYLASQLGISTKTAAASVLMELAVTVAGWFAAAGLGWGYFHSSYFSDVANQPSIAPRTVAIGVCFVIAAAISLGIGGTFYRPFRSRISHSWSRILAILDGHVDWPRLGIAAFFFFLMAVFNGLTLFVIVRSTAAGQSPPVIAVIAANAVAWLVGFFALFAPGGLVVREACLVSLLSPWIAAEQAIVISLTWRLLQILAEIICFGGVACLGLPGATKITESHRH
jgi:hypothetical protein